MIRNILVHNNKMVNQDNIDEFEKKSIQYDQNLTRNDLCRLFNYRVAAKISLIEFEPDVLKNFRDVLDKVL